MIYWSVFLIYITLYSIGVTILAKRNRSNRYLIYLIPFLAFFYIDKQVQEFKILSIRINSWGKTVIILALISAGAYLYWFWGVGHLDEKNIQPLTQIMLVPIAFSVLVFWLGNIFSTLKLLHNYNARFKLDTVLCMLMLPIPLMLALSSRKKEFIKEVKE